MLKTLHSLDILNPISYSMLYKLQGLSNIHISSVLAEELSQDIKENKKYIEFLDFLEREYSLHYVYYKISFLSKSLNCISFVNTSWPGL